MRVMRLSDVIGVLCILVSFGYGVSVGSTIQKEPTFISNPPVTITEWPDKICYNWYGKYNSQIITCIKR
jgi:hypothetical protein